MRGTLQQEAQQAMQDAREAGKAVAEAQPSDEDKLKAYQATTAAIMTEAGAGKSEHEFTYANYPLLRYVGEALVTQGIGVKFNIERCSLTAKWG